MKHYHCKEPVEVTVETWSRVQELLSLDLKDQSLSNQRKIGRLKAESNQIAYSFFWSFEDNTQIRVDIVGGEQYYYIEAYAWDKLFPANFTVLITPEEFRLRTVFEFDMAQYICEFEVIDTKNSKYSEEARSIYCETYWYLNQLTSRETSLDDLCGSVEGLYKDALGKYSYHTNKIAVQVIEQNDGHIDLDDEFVYYIKGLSELSKIYNIRDI